MSTFRNPVGPQPTTVYWRRRLVVGIALLAIIVVILLIVFSPKGSTPTATETTPAADPGSAQTPGATDAPATDSPACDTADLTVTASADKASYTADEVPQLSFVVTNEGSGDCVFTADTDMQQWTISSGSEVYWDSTDCPPENTPGQVVLTANGGEATGGPLTWNRTRSDKTDCEGAGTAVPAGDVTYSLTVTVSGVESKPVKMRLL